MFTHTYSSSSGYCTRLPQMMWVCVPVPHGCCISTAKKMKVNKVLCTSKKTCTASSSSSLSSVQGHPDTRPVYLLPSAQGCHTPPARVVWKRRSARARSCSSHTPSLGSRYTRTSAPESKQSTTHYNLVVFRTTTHMHDALVSSIARWPFSTSTGTVIPIIGSCPR